MPVVSEEKQRTGKRGRPWWALLAAGGRRLVHLPRAAPPAAGGPPAAARRIFRGRNPPPARRGWADRLYTPRWRACLYTLLAVGAGAAMGGCADLARAGEINDRHRCLQ